MHFYLFLFRSGQDLSNLIPSTKIVIQKSIDKLETAWSQMLSVWSSRNGLYEKNLDLRVRLQTLPLIKSFSH